MMSAATLWEMAIEVSLGKLSISLPYRQWMDKVMTDLVLDVLPITLGHAERQVSLPWHHRDPFDRLLVAQALVEAVPLVSADPALDAYGITRLWLAEMMIIDDFGKHWCVLVGLVSNRDMQSRSYLSADASPRHPRLSI